MLKLLNKISNAVFVLPDEQAIRMFNKDKETFEIIDGGYIEVEEPRKPTIQELVMVKETKKRVQKEELKEQKMNKPLDVNEMNLFELRRFAERLQIKYASKMNKKEAIEAINKVLNEKENK